MSPFDVEVRASNSAGIAYKFDTATLTSDGFSADGTVADATAHFAGVQLAPGPHTLTARINKGTCSRTASIDVTVKSEACTTPAVTAVAFPQDTSNDGILNAAELPQGTNLQVRVTAQCTTGVQVQVKRGTTVVGGPADFSNGMATVTLPTLPDSDSATYDLVAELVQGGAPVGMSLGGSIRVERALPACQNTTALVQGPSNGGAGTEHTLTATGTTTGVTAQFRLDGAQAMTSTPSGGMVSASWSVPKMGETTYAVELRCTDNFGNVATDTRMVRVDYVAPTAAITQPTTNPDGGATTVTDSPTVVQVMTNAEDGAQACAFRVQGTTRTQIDCAPVSGGAVSIDVPFPLDGTYTIEVEVADLAGNTTTTSVAVSVVLSGCGIGFTRPSACPALITAAQVNNGVYAFQTQSNPSCSGQTVRLSVQTVSADGGIGPEMSVGTGSIAGTGLATIPGTVTSGEYVYSAEVDNIGVDAGVSRASCDVTVDLDRPAIQSPVVPTGQPYATINVAQDTQPGTCGAQRLLQFSARVPAGGRVDVCTTQAVDPCTMAARPTSPACGAGWYVMQSNVTSPASGFTFTEGEYSIKVVVVSSSATSESAAVPVFVDVTRPCVVRQASPWPQDTAGGMADGKLNIAELGSNAPRLQFALGCGDVDPTTLSATSPVVVREIVSGNPTGSFNLAADATFASALYSVNLTQGVANEKDYSFFVELTDKAGNKNLYAGGAMDPARYDMRIDRVAPSCDIVFPSAGNTMLGLADVPGGNFTVTVGTSADVLTNGVSVTLAGPTTTTRQLTPAGPAYQAQTTFAVTGTNAWTVSSTCTDTAGNATAATARNLTIDLDAPTCTITSPTNSAPYAVNDIVTTLNVTGGDGRLVTCTTNGMPLSPQLLVTSGTATHLLSYPNGTQTVACSLTDTANNPGSCQVIGVVVNSMSCGFNLTSTQTTASGFWHNRSNTGSLTANSGVATVTANTPDCGMGKTVTLRRVAPTAGTPVTATTDSMGNVSFPGVAVVDGERWDVTIDNGAGLLTTRSFRVGLVAPAAAGVSIGGAAVTTGTNLYFVAASGNRNADTGTAGYFADTNAGAAGAQFDVAVNGVTGAFKAGLNGEVQLVFKGSVVASQNVTADPQSFTFTSATLPHNDSGAFEVRVVDTAGNSTSVINNPSAIDVIAPGAPTVTQNLTNARAAQVTLQWAPTYDDGVDSASGGHAGYDVRWTTSSVPNNNAMAASSDYFGSSSYQDTLSAWSATNITRVVDLPPLNTYYIAVRAKDEVGNYSSFAAPTSLANDWTEVTLGGPAGSNFGQTVMSGFSLNGDGIDDVVVGAPNRATNIGSVFVYWGGPTFTSQPSCVPPSCLELQPRDGQSGLFGGDLSAAGDVGNVGGELVRDLVVAQSGWSSNVGRVFIYFGGVGGAPIDPAQVIEIRGDTATNRFGTMVSIIRDINGDGLDELAVGSSGFNGNQGRVYIFHGRSRAQWVAASTGVDGTNTYIPVGAATWVLDGPLPLLDATVGNGFGLFRLGNANLGDFTGDSRGDFAVPLSRTSINRVALYSGAAVVAAGQFDAGVTFPFSGALQVLAQPVQTGTGTNGFGASATGGVDVLGATRTDFVVGQPSSSVVHIYADLDGSGVAGGAPVASIAGTSSFGTSVATADVNGDGYRDILAGEGLGTNNHGWVVYRRPTGFAQNLASTSSPPFFASSLAGGAGSSLGRSISAGDVDHSGMPNGIDVILGDQVQNRVVVRK
ncbi:MAG: Ig-like domain repeat protein [Myxococcota bacterium]